MSVQLYTLTVCLVLLLAVLCPGTHCKHGGIFRGRGKGDGNKESQSQSKGLSKQGLKVVGAAAAAAGMLGGTGTGYGLGFLGKGKHGSGHKKILSDQQKYHREGQRSGNQSQWNAAAPKMNNCVIILGYAMPFLIISWIR